MVKNFIFNKQLKQWKDALIYFYKANRENERVIDGVIGFNFLKGNLRRRKNWLLHN